MTETLVVDRWRGLVVVSIIVSAATGMAFHFAGVLAGAEWLQALGLLLLLPVALGFASVALAAVGVQLARALRVLNKIDPIVYILEQPEPMTPVVLPQGDIDVALAERTLRDRHVDFNVDIKTLFNPQRREAVFKFGAGTPKSIVNDGHARQAWLNLMVGHWRSGAVLKFDCSNVYGWMIDWVGDLLSMLFGCAKGIKVQLYGSSQGLKDALNARKVTLSAFAP